MLARLQVRATFFVLGSAVEAHPELIAREVAEGHEVAVHNWVHTDVYGVSFSELSDSVNRTCEAIVAAGAPSPRLWRPPYGRVDAPAMMVASRKRMDLLLWSVHTPSTAEAAAVKDLAGAGSVVLCHDGRTQPSAPCSPLWKEACAHCWNEDLPSRRAAISWHPLRRPS